MPDERESPSAGWREVYYEMDADTRIEEAVHPCPDCGRPCENVARDVYDCKTHGIFRASAAGDASDSSGHDETESGPSARDSDESADPDESDPPDADETTNRGKWSAGPV